VLWQHIMLCCGAVARCASYDARIYCTVNAKVTTEMMSEIIVTFGLISTRIPLQSTSNFCVDRTVFFTDKSVAPSRPSLLFFLSQSDISCFKFYRNCKYNYEQCIISNNKADIRYSSALTTPVPTQHQHR